MSAVPSSPLVMRSYREALSGVDARRVLPRLAARLGLARWAGRWISDKGALAIVLADLERFCRALPSQSTFEPDDPSGRIQAYAEGLRQAYNRISLTVALTPEQYRRALERLEEERTSHVNE